MVAFLAFTALLIAGLWGFCISQAVAENTRLSRKTIQLLDPEDPDGYYEDRDAIRSWKDSP